MVVDFFCPRWGAEDIPWDNFLQQVRAAGYRGIEWFPFGENTDEVIALLGKYGLKFSIVMTVPGNYADFSAYLGRLDKQLREYSFLGQQIGGPLFVTAQTGREYADAEQIDLILNCCKQVEADMGVSVYQETHRNKWAYALHVLPVVLHRNPETSLTLDVSHWFCVSESYLEDQQDALNFAITRTKHIHARIGYTQGVQVPDPSWPEYARAMEEHLKIWDRWIAQQRQTGKENCVITPEFGPFPYLIQTNKTIKAYEQQWSLNLWMKDLLNRRYNL